MSNKHAGKPSAHRFLISALGHRLRALTGVVCTWRGAVPLSEDNRTAGEIAVLTSALSLGWTKKKTSVYLTLLVLSTDTSVYLPPCWTLLFSPFTTPRWHTLHCCLPPPYTHILTTFLFLSATYTGAFFPPIDQQHNGPYNTYFLLLHSVDYVVTLHCRDCYTQCAIYT